MAVNKELFILELRSGIGGQESNIFVEQLLKMYYKFAIKNNWGFEIQDINKSSSEGIREVRVKILGLGIGSWIVNECGVHRIQRVPKTETKGRIHTSTVSVVGLPILNDDYSSLIKRKDLRIETMRSTGAGGQHVNTTDSAVRITHLPTGISAMSSLKSQHRNKANALLNLKTKIEKNIIYLKKANQTLIRSNQISWSIRTAKIRTYNFIRDIVIDHRLGVTIKGIAKILNGNLEIINPLHKDYLNVI
ncbi:Peptide chain release factor 1 [Candidatus Hodgkinia cicadicola]|uniref:Peptide chain release factor 1 n=1 Tax=Candidatus Hodgkinia cicadicola TaxID=573658 RepID=A0ABX4MJ04_9HYPH|nr:Peptide chain release factor 1 [Candidatus Hodgkinia cicadicola]PIM95936.1 Peptide chain release factor 1 [Candidatus Hodgkinia cicadicola]